MTAFCRPSQADRLVAALRAEGEARVLLRLRLGSDAWLLDPAFEAVERPCSAPDAGHLLCIGREEMLRRMARTPEPFPKTPEVRDLRFSAMVRLAGASRSGLVPIDAERDAGVVHEEVVEHVRSRARRSSR